MVWELILAILCGVSAGTFTGLSPGIHINLIAAFLLSFYSFWQDNPLVFLVFVISMSITHVFLDFIPSVFLGAPEEGTFLSVLPGHELMLQGQGFKAVSITLMGSLMGVLISVFSSPILIFLSPHIYPFLIKIIPFLLIFISIYLVFRSENIIPGLLVFLLSGFLGIVTFSLPVREPLMPLLTGLFGASGIILSIQNTNKIPYQKLSPILASIPKLSIIKSSLSSLIFTPLLSLIPGISSGHVATLSSELIPQKRKEFLFLNGCVSAMLMSSSFLVLFSINKARTGSAAALKSLIPSLSSSHLLIIFISIIFSAFIAFFLGILIARYSSQFLSKIPYRLLSIFVLIFLILVSFLLSGFLGIVIVLSGSFLGLFALKSDIRRINLMGCLLLPTIIYYLSA